MGSATLRLESHGMLDAIYLPILIMHGEGYHPLKRVEGEENCITRGPAIVLRRSSRAFDTPEGAAPSPSTDAAPSGSGMSEHPR